MLQITKFPTIPATVKNVRRTVVEQAEALFTVPPDGHMEAVMQSAWGLLVSLYLDEEEVTIASGIVPRPTAADALPVIFAVPFVISCDTSVRHLRETAAKYTAAAMRRETSDSVKSPPSSVLLAASDFGRVVPTSEGWTRCALLLLYSHEDNRLAIEAHTDPRVLPCYQARRILVQLCHIATQIATGCAVVGSIDFLDEASKMELEAWNSAKPACDTTITHLISTHVTSRPDAEALSAHDGRMTYAELHAHTGRLAAHLIRLGLAPGDYVPLLFDKSIWCIVSMIAVLRAGAAFVPLSPEYPRDRIKFICAQVSARMALASDSLAPTMDTIVSTVVVICSDMVIQLRQDDSVTLPPPDAKAVAYIMHTSGSTGLPKGAQLEHRSIVASARNVIARTSMSPTTRSLHFSNYIYGAAMAEIWSALIVGGCLCIPSEEQRLSSLDAFVINHRVTWAIMTPTLARRHGPATMPGLDTLVVGGEAITADILQRWASSVQLYAAYGSAEQSHIISIDGPMDPSANGASIGRIFEGSYAWVVMPKNVDQLVPLGCIGELITEGPQIARGYIREPERTQTSFPQSFSWRDRFSSFSSVPSRFYRTGDIVRYTTEGRLEYLNRREGYVKINSQRVELGEIENQMRSILPETYQVCVELCAAAGESAENAVLVAFLAQSDDQIPTDHELFRTIQAHLSSVLPPFMIPRYYYPLRTMPTTISGKTARAELRDMVAALSPEHLVRLAAGRAGRRQVESSAEKYMQKVWATVLNIPESAILADDTFWDLGGDSRKAVSLHRTLREDGHDISVRQILAEPRLSTMAQKCLT